MKALAAILLLVFWLLFITPTVLGFLLGWLF